MKGCRKIKSAVESKRSDRIIFRTFSSHLICLFNSAFRGSCLHCIKIKPIKKKLSRGHHWRLKSFVTLIIQCRYEKCLGKHCFKNISTFDKPLVDVELGLRIYLFENRFFYNGSAAASRLKTIVTFNESLKIAFRVNVLGVFNSADLT